MPRHANLKFEIPPLERGQKWCHPIEQAVSQFSSSACSQHAAEEGPGRPGEWDVCQGDVAPDFPRLIVNYACPEPTVPTCGYYLVLTHALGIHHVNFSCLTVRLA